MEAASCFYLCEKKAEAPLPIPFVLVSSGVDVKASPVMFHTDPEPQGCVRMSPSSPGKMKTGPGNAKDQLVQEGSFSKCQ